MQTTEGNQPPATATTGAPSSSASSGASSFSMTSRSGAANGGASAAATGAAKYRRGAGGNGRGKKDSENDAFARMCTACGMTKTVGGLALFGAIAFLVLCAVAIAGGVMYSQRAAKQKSSLNTSQAQVQALSSQLAAGQSALANMQQYAAQQQAAITALQQQQQQAQQLQQQQQMAQQQQLAGGGLMSGQPGGVVIPGTGSPVMTLPPGVVPTAAVVAAHPFASLPQRSQDAARQLAAQSGISLDDAARRVLAMSGGQLPPLNDSVRAAADQAAYVQFAESMAAPLARDLDARMQASGIGSPRAPSAVVMGTPLDEAHGGGPVPFGGLPPPQQQQQQQQFQQQPQILPLPQPTTLLPGAGSVNMPGGSASMAPQTPPLPTLPLPMAIMPGVVASGVVSGAQDAQRGSTGAGAGVGAGASAAGSAALPAATGEQVMSAINAPSAISLGVIVVSSTCGHCTALKQTLAGLQAGGQLANAVYVLMDASELSKIGDKMPLSGVPAMFKVRGNGIVTKGPEGNLPPPDLLTFLLS